jgi:hypothetical protein
MVLPVVHPLKKTKIDLRRSINRLNVYIQQNPEDDYVKSGEANQVLDRLEEAQRLIPKAVGE